MAWTHFPASTLPAPYDIVWCKFPYGLNFEVPGPINHPALVMQSGFSDPGFCPEVRVIYGTSILKTRERRHDFFVQNFQDMYDSGLHKATRFDLDRCLWLPWCAEFFGSPGDQYPTPVMGSLPDHLRRVLGFCLFERKKRLGLTEAGE